jgi:mRNA-degrading endonuclease toxin of MazEF toxin-antitoxin module
MQPRKIRVADIERLRRSLENVPESRVQEVTTCRQSGC